MNENYTRVKTFFQERNYRQVISIYRRTTSHGKLNSWFWFDDCGLFAPLAYAYLGDYNKSIEAFREYMKYAYCRKPQLALQKCGPAFIKRLGERKPALWLELWFELRHLMTPIEALVEDLWDPDLEPDDETARQPIYEKLNKYGEAAVPPLLNALAINDCNEEVQRFEKDYPKIALANIGDPAFEALEAAIFSPPKIDVCGNLSIRLGRAAIKMLWRFGDDRAEPVLHRALADPNVSYKYYVEQQLQSIEYRRRKTSS